MVNLYKLRNQVKHYEWGSADLIPQLMGCAPDGVSAGIPVAELWMGSLSAVDAPDSLGGTVSLGELIAAQRYGALPFLFKLLAAEKPLSVQVHPNPAQAREGFERENRAGLALDAPNRSYRDANHKPEIICALTSFMGMCGFRRPAEIHRSFEAFLPTAPMLVRKRFVPLLQALEIPAADAALRNFSRLLFSFEPLVRMSLTEFILSVKSENSDEWKLMRDFARDYPLDPAIIAPLYLNIFRLEPGEALFLQAGVPHAYLQGFGVELMANSDNVLRGGLTRKYIDVRELIKVLDYAPLEPQIMKPKPGESCFTYPSSCKEFSLTVMRGGGINEQIFTHNAPAICIVTEGEVSLSGTILKQGESAFIPPGDSLVLQGNYTLYIASSGGTASAGGTASVPPS